MATTTPVQDTAYAGLGLTVLAWRQANEAFERLSERLGTGRFQDLRERAENTRSQVTDFVTPYVERAGEQFDRFIARLPEDTQKTYRDALAVGKKVAEDYQAFVRGLTAEASAPRPRATKAAKANGKAAEAA